MNRTQIINNLIKDRGYVSYLEIGVSEKDNFNKIVCKKKIGVDPAKNHHIYDYNICSDEFFQLNTFFFDIIFIDGLHTAEQVEKDILNSLSILNTDGCVVVHDTNPPTEFHQLENQNNTLDTPANKDWCGTVWKAIFKLRKNRSDLIFKTYMEDYGITIIEFGQGSILELENKYFSFEIFSNFRKQILNSY